MNEVNYLVLSSTIDYSTDLICAELEKRNAKYLRINRDHFTTYDIIYSFQNAELNIRMGDSWHSLRNDSVRSVYFRAPVFLRTTGKPYTVQEQLCRSQWSAFIRNLIVFEKASWINHPVATYRAENKLYQLRVAQKCGLAVPETYVGNHLPESIDPKRMYIIKSLDTALFHDGNIEMFTYSTMVDGKELFASEIKDAPIIIQEYLAEKTDIRVSIIGDAIYAVRITKSGNSIVGDWRKRNKDDLDYIPVELPIKIKERLVALMKELNLSFGGVDLALVGDTYYFIEVNPTGEWGWLTSSAKIPVDKAIVDYMIVGGMQ